MVSEQSQVQAVQGSLYASDGYFYMHIYSTSISKLALNALNASGILLQRSRSPFALIEIGQQLTKKFSQILAISYIEKNAVHIFVSKTRLKRILR